MTIRLEKIENGEIFICFYIDHSDIHFYIKPHGKLIAATYNDEEIVLIL